MFDGVLEKIQAADAAEAEATPETPEATPEAPAEESAPEAEESTAATETVEYEEEVEAAPEADDQAPEETPAAPETLKIDDNLTYLDPVTGETMTGRELKNQRLMQADYTRKTQELAEQRRELEARLAEGTADKPEAEVTEEDPLADLDPDDPLVRKTKALEATIAANNKQLEAIMAQNEQLATAVQAREAQEQARELEATEKRLLEEIPVLEKDDIEAAEFKYLAAVRRGESVTLEGVVQKEAERLMKIADGSVSKWKEKHRKVKQPSEPGGAPAGAAAESGPTAEEFMEDGLAGRIAREDAEARREAQK